MSNINNAISALSALEVARDKLMQIYKRDDLDNELIDKLHNELCIITERTNDFEKYVEELKQKD